MQVARVYYGALVNPVDINTVDVLPKSLIAVGEDGTIAWLESDVPSSLVQDRLAKHSWADAHVVELRDSEWLMPGLVDTHTHAPQFPNIGVGQQYQLLDWLTCVTFPEEAKHKDPEYSKRVYPEVIRRSVRYGTTTCCYYGSLHLEASKVLANVALQIGQRAFVGKCNMDNQCPSTYIEESAEQSVRDTQTLVEYIASLNSELVRPIVTPRFAISCTSDLLGKLGSLLQTNPDLPIQTHISENLDEIELTRRLFPQCKTYAEVYDSYGLLRHNTILAHAVHLEDSEIQLIRNRQSGISHCPTSNLNLRSGCADVGKLLDAGLKIGLGTDCSGGYSPSILTAIQHASIVSKVVSLGSKESRPGFEGKPLPIPTLVYLATLGGASLCNLEDKIGSFAVGKDFDALLVNVADECGNSAISMAQGKEELSAMLEKFLFCGDDRNIRTVWVQGRAILET